MRFKLAYRHPASLRGLSTKAPTSVPSLCLIFSLSFAHSLCTSMCVHLFSALSLESHSAPWIIAEAEHLPGFRRNARLSFIVLGIVSTCHITQDPHTGNTCNNWPLLHCLPLHLTHTGDRALCLISRGCGPEIKAILESKAAWLWKSIILFCHGNGSCQAPRRRKVEFFTQMLCASLDVLRLTLRCFWSPSQSA